MLTVTRVAGGSGWQATVESPNVTKRCPAPLPTRIALRDVLAYARRVNAEAEQQAEREAQAGRDQETLW